MEGVLGTGYDPPPLLDICASVLVIAFMLIFVLCKLWRQRQLRRNTLKSIAAEARAETRKPQNFNNQTPSAEDQRAGVDGGEEADEIMRVDAKHFCLSSCKGLLLPFVTLDVLGKRVRLIGSQACGRFGLHLSLLLAFAGLPIGPRATSIMVGIAILLLGLTLFGYCRLVSNDHRWREIHNFAEHRRVRLNFDNGLAITSVVISFLQMGGIASRLWRKPPPSTEVTNYERAKQLIERVTGVALLDVRFAFDTDFKVGAAYGQSCLVLFLVILWWLLYGGLAYQVLDLASAHLQESPELLARKNATRCEVYKRIRARDNYKRLFVVISDTLATAIVAGLVGVLDCWPADDGSMRLEIDPRIACFEGNHVLPAVLAILAATFYIVVATLTAPFLVADAEGALDNSNLDVRHEALFLAEERLCRSAAAVVAIYWNHYKTVGRLTNCLFAFWLAYRTTATQPCSVPEINAARAGFYQASVIVSLAVLFDAHTEVDWYPLIFLALGLLMALLHTARTAWSHLGAPILEETGLIGTIFQDSTWFSDISLLRGAHNRLKTVVIYGSGKGNCKGLKCMYEVDGVVLPGPLHMSSTSGNHATDFSQVLELAHNEYIIALHCAGGDPRFNLSLATNKGRRVVRGEVPPQEVSQWMLTAPSGQVVGLHGFRNGHLHSLGFILQKPTPHHETARARALGKPIDTE